MSKRRSMDFKEKEKAIQDYANANTNGNFTQAVNELVKSGLEQLTKGETK